MEGKYRIETGESPDGAWATVHFFSGLEPAECIKLRDEMLALIADGGLRRWIFDFTLMQYCTTTDLGLWVSSHTSLENRGGRLEIRAPEDSSVAKVIRLSRLDAILNVEFF